MKKIEIVESATCPGPGYVRVDRECVERINNLMERLDVTRAKVRQGIAELTTELEHRRSLGEDI